VEATVDAKGVDWNDHLGGRLRAERSSDCVRLNLSQWDREDHTISATANLEPAAARELATRLRDRVTGVVTHDDADGWVTMGWVDFRGYDDADSTATVTLDTLQDDETAVLSIQYESPGGVITTEAPLDDQQIAALASWLAYAAEGAEAYEPPEPAQPAAALSSESSDGSPGPMHRGVSWPIGLGISIGVGVIVTNAMFSRLDMTINGEPVTAPSGPSIGMILLVIVSLAVFIGWAMQYLPGRIGGGPGV